MHILPFRPPSMLGRDLLFDAPPEIEALLSRLGRTEDLRFSPDFQRVAIAGFARDEVVILDLNPGLPLMITGAVVLRHRALRDPRGLEWIDHAHLAVTSRSHRVQVVMVPWARDGFRSEKARLRKTIRRIGLFKKLDWPGALACVRHGDHLGLWVCNNFANRLSYHVLRDKWYKRLTRRNRVALSEGLDVPEGIAVNNDCTRIAVSNHQTNEVFVYGICAAGRIVQIGTITGLGFPQGLRFLPGGDALIVADGGAPFLYVCKTATRWHGVHRMARKVRIMDDMTFRKVHQRAWVGGVKGLDIDPVRGIVATTCEAQALQFYRMSDILGLATDDVDHTPPKVVIRRRASQAPAPG